MKILKWVLLLIVVILTLGYFSPEIIEWLEGLSSDEK